MRPSSLVKGIAAASVALLLIAMAAKMRDDAIDSERDVGLANSVPTSNRKETEFKPLYSLTADGGVITNEPRKAEWVTIERPSQRSGAAVKTPPPTMIWTPKTNRRPKPDTQQPQLTSAQCAYFNAAPQRFLSFEPWPGGWNNRRLSLECAAVLAILTARTLVLPPTTTKIYDEHVPGAKMLGFEGAYNMDLMRRHIPTVTFDEMLACGKNLLEGLPLRPKNCSNTPPGSKDRFYCEASLPVSERAQLVNVNGGHFYPLPYKAQTDPKGHGRRAEQVPDASSVIAHYQRNLLCCFSNMVYIDPKWREDAVGAIVAQQNPQLANATVKSRVFGTMRDAFAYNDEIQDLAKQVVEELGGVDGFSCVHLRRRDFKLQYPYTIGEPSEVLHNLAPVFKPNETVLVATDDDTEVREALKNPKHTLPNIRWLLWPDLKTDTKVLVRILIPLVVQQVCVAARVFAPNPFSTYSGLMVRLRGYRGAMGPYYTTVKIKPDDPNGLQPDNLRDKDGPTWGHETFHGWTGI